MQRFGDNIVGVHLLTERIDSKVHRFGNSQVNDFGDVSLGNPALHRPVSINPQIDSPFPIHWPQMSCPFQRVSAFELERCMNLGSFRCYQVNAFGAAAPLISSCSLLIRNSFSRQARV